jgi:hypothetical protein
MKRLERYFILFVAFFCFLVSFADIFGLLGSLPWLTTRIPTITLLLISVVLAYLVIERGNKLDVLEALIGNRLDALESGLGTGVQELLSSLEKATQRIITAHKGSDILLFESRKKFFDYAMKRVQRAKQIDVTHFGLSAPSHEDTDSVDYYQTFSSVIKEGKLRVRRILIVRNHKHVEWARQMLEDFSGCPSFYLAAYPSPLHYIPMINLMIIDGAEVYLGGGERAPSDDPKAILVKHPDFTESIQEHFKTLWRDSVELKNSSDLDRLLKGMEGFSDRSN